MKTVTIRELHAKTGELVRQARKYGQILVTDNGRPVAKIIPEEESDLPYFARHTPSKAFQALDAKGQTGRGTDSTHGLSEDREDRA